MGVSVTWNPLDPEFRVDPYPTYRALLEHEPFHRSPFGPIVLSRYDDVQTVLRHPAASSDDRKSPNWVPPEGYDPETASPTFLSLDPPDHTRLRGLVSKAFTPRRVEALRPRMQEIVDQIFDQAAEAGRMEVVADLAFPLPVLMICEMLGIPGEDVDEFKDWSAAAARSLDPDFVLPPDIIERAREASERAEAYFMDLIARRRKEPCDDLLSALLAVEEQGDQLTEGEMLGTLALLLIAGHETTVNLVANGFLAFARHPDQFARLRDDPSRVKSAVEEVLRFDPPVHGDTRLALEDIEVSTGTIPQFEQPVLLLAASNRDGEHFSDPDRFDIGRTDNRHLAFGFGIHHCLGAPLARAEGQVALGTLARRFGEIALTEDPPPYKENIVLRGVATLEVELEVAAAAAR